MNTKLIVAAVFFTSFLCLLTPGTASATNYTLTLTAQGSGIIYRNPTNTTYPAGVTVTLTGTANPGWYFSNWTGDTNSSLNPLNVVINSNMNVTGNFVAYPVYSLTLATNGQGGIVLSPPAGNYYSNTEFTATATAANGWVFAGWSGATNSNANPVSFALNTNGTLTGTFAQPPAFDVQPVSVTNKAGSTVSFTTHAVGTGLVNYQWYFSGGTPNNGNNSTLSLTNVGSAQTGSYWAVATNNYGSATSHVATLTLTNSTGPTNFVVAPNQVSLLSAIAAGGWIGVEFNGTLTLTNTINITNNVVLDGTGYATLISGGNAVQMFNVASNASLTISNLTLANGLATNNPAGGGAICDNGGYVMLVGCTLTNNVAQSADSGGLAEGGAIFNNGGTVSLYQSLIISNSVTGLQGSGTTMGGAVCQASGTMNITSCVFTLNQVIGGLGTRSYPPPILNQGSPAYGGAMAVTSGSLAIDLSQFTDNQAMGAAGEAGTEGGGAGPAGGGAIYCAAGCSATDSSFSGNQAISGNYIIYSLTGLSGCGGAIYNGGSLTLIRCAVYDNETQGGSMATSSGPLYGGSGFGGGIYNAAQLVATNCTIALNSALGAPAYGENRPATSGNAVGGGIYNDSSATSVFMNLTIASNSCSSPLVVGEFGLTVSSNGLAAGFQIGNGNTNGTFGVHNTLIACSGTNTDAYGPITDVGYNICSDGSASLFSGSSYNYTDPKLGLLGNYGGPTLTMALLSISPAIDNGDINGCPNTDQRGYVRPFGSGPDIGAFEYGSAAAANNFDVNISVTSSNATLSFPAFTTFTYYLQYSTNLTSWVNLSTNGPFAVSTNVSQTVGIQGINRCFFRVLQQ